MNKKKLGYMLVICIFMLCSCGKEDENNNIDFANPNIKSNELEDKKIHLDDYLSISYTSYNDNSDPENGMTTHIILYDISNDKLIELNSVGYTSQYPLSIYSKHDNKIYYSSKNLNTGKGDELFSLDLDTGETRQLTNDLFAINYILPRKDDILLVAVKKKTRALRLIKYDKDSGNITYNNLEDDDTDVWSIGLNVENENEFFIAKYSSEQQYSNIQKQATGENSKFIYPDNTIVKYTNAFEAHKDILFIEKEKAKSISANNKYLVIYHTSGVTFEERTITKIDLETDESTIINIPNVSSYSEVCIDKESNGIYFLGSMKNSNSRGIYYYNFSTDEVKEIFLEESGIGSINNVTLVGE